MADPLSVALTREAALVADRADPLVSFAAHFTPLAPGRLYVDGNSLGRPTRDSAVAVAGLIADWENRLVGAWEDWIAWPVRLGDAIGGLIGARPGETLVCDSVSVNLFKLARAVLDVRPGSVLVDPTDFPTDRWVLQGLGRPLVACGPDAAAVAAHDDVALAVFSLVHYRSGALADLRAVTEAVHAAGGLVLWDLSHAAGAVEIDLHGVGADLAVGCTYKFLGAGPGAPAFLWVRDELQERLTSPIQGWFGAADPFAMGDAYAPAPGVTRFLAGTPPIVAMAAIEPGVALLAEAGMEAVATKSRALTQLAVELHDAWLEPLGFTLGTPRDPSARGAHVALCHPDAWRICRALIERADVVPDFRRPDAVRFGFPALSTSHAEVWDACDRLRTLVASGEYERVDAGPRRVT